MQIENKNKMIDQSSNKDVEFEFHFGGDLKYLPAVVKAKGFEEAQEKWEKIRVPINQNN